MAEDLPSPVKSHLGVRVLFTPESITIKGDKKMNSINKNAKMAGVLYLIYMVTHIISDVWRDSFNVPGDAAGTGNVSAVSL